MERQRFFKVAPNDATVSNRMILLNLHESWTVSFKRLRETALLLAGQLLEIRDHVTALISFYQAKIHVVVGHELFRIGQPLVQ